MNAQVLIELALIAWARGLVPSLVISDQERESYERFILLKHFQYSCSFYQNYIQLISDWYLRMCWAKKRSNKEKIISVENIEEKEQLVEWFSNWKEFWLSKSISRSQFYINRHPLSNQNWKYVMYIEGKFKWKFSSNLGSNS